MRRYQFYLAIFFAFVSILFPLCSAQAVLAPNLSFNLNTIYSGTGIPTNPAPWITATFTDIAPGEVSLTISAIGLTAAEKSKEICFNLDPALDPALLAFSNPTKTGSFDNPTIDKGVDSFQADGDGKYDIHIAFSEDGPSRAFNGGETVSYTITLAGLTASSFNFGSAHGGGQGQYYAAAQIQNLGISGPYVGQSAWIAAPEPATLLLLAAGAMGILRKRK